MEEHIIIAKKCPICGQDHTVSVYKSDWINYTEHSYLIQDAFPYLSSADREIILTGVCAKCWDYLFSE